MNIQLDFGFKDVLAIVAGIVIFMAPKMSKYIIAVYLILIGLIGVFGLRI